MQQWLILCFAPSTSVTRSTLNVTDCALHFTCESAFVHFYKNSNFSGAASHRLAVNKLRMSAMSADPKNALDQNMWEKRIYKKPGCQFSLA